MERWSVVKNAEPLQLLRSPTPVPQGCEILVEVGHCGVCRSDLQFWKGFFDLGGGQILRITDRGAKLPCAPGHEISGRVVALGPEATGVAVGDERIVYPWVGCGKCELCLSDQENLCSHTNSLGVIRDGGFGTHVLVPNSSYLFEHDGVDPALAATFACSALTVYSAIKKLPPMLAAQPVLVIGAGGLGLTSIAMLRALGHDNIILLDPNRAHREAALEAGARRALDNSTGLSAEVLLTECGGTLLAALDFVNKPETVSLALGSPSKGGTLVLVGLGGGEIHLSLAGMVFRPRTIVGSIAGSRQHLREVIELARSGKFTPLPITLMPKNSANSALQQLDSHGVIGRIVLTDRP